MLPGMGRRLGGLTGWRGGGNRYWRNPWPRGSARRGRWMAGWPSGLRNTAWIIASLTALPDQTTDYGGLTLNWLLRRSVWLPFRRVAQSSYRWVTTLQSTLAPTPVYRGIGYTAVGICRCPLLRLGVQGSPKSQSPRLGSRGARRLLRAAGPHSAL